MELDDFFPDFLVAADLVTLPDLLPPGVPLDDFGVLGFLDEELDFDFERAEGDGEEVREEGDDRREDDGVEDRSASSTYLVNSSSMCDFRPLEVALNSKR